MAGREKSTRIVKKLKQTEERYRELFDSINVCVAVYKAKNEGEDFIIKDFNTAAENVEKVSRRDIIGKSILAVFPGIKDFGILEVMQRVWKTEVPERFPVKLYKDNKIIGWRDNYIYKLPSGDIVDVYEDVTERKKGEEALNEAEQRYKIVADFTYDWEFWRGPGGKMLYVSPACERITGYTPTQFIKDPRLMDKIVIPEDKSIRAAHLDRIKDNVSDLVIYRIKRKDGDVRWIEHVCRPILDGKGAFLGTRGSNRDITDRKQAEKKLEESEVKYRTILESMDEAYYETDLKGNLTFFNDALPRLLGYTWEELLGMNYSKFVPASDYKAIRALFIQVYRTGGTSQLHRQAHIIKDGRTVYVDVSAIPIKNTRGEVTGFRGVLWDITARVKAEEELKFRAELLDSATDSIHVIDHDGNFIYANEAFYKTRGYTLEEIMSLKMRDLITPENAAILDERIAEAASKGEVVFESVHLCKDGKSIPVEVHSRPILHNGQTCLLSVVRDISERKKTEDALRKSEEQYRLLAENADDCIWTLDTDLHVTYISPSVRKIRNVEPEEAMMESVADIMTPASLKRVMDELELNRTDIEKGIEKSVKLEIEHYRKDGSTVWVETIIRALYNNEGKNTGFIGVSRDISERKTKDETLRQSEELYRLVAENSDDCIWRLDADFNYTYISPSIYKLRGFEPEEAMRQSLKESTAPQSLAVVKKDIAEFLKEASQGKSRTSRVEIEQYRQDGTTVWVESVCRSYLDANGKVAGYIGTSRDITERKKTDEALRESQAKYSDLLENAGEAILIAQDGLIKFINTRLTGITGYTAAEFLDTPFIRYVHKDDVDMVSTTHAARMRGEKVESDYVFRVVTRDGQTRWVEIHAALVTWEGRPASLNFLSDITERRQAEEALMESESRYKLLEEFTDDVVWVLDRDLHLTYVSRSIRKLRGVEPEEAMQEEFASIMTPQSLQKIRHLLKVNLSRIEEGRDGSARIEIEQYRKDRSTIWVELNMKELRDNTGKFIGFTGTSRDITARKASEQAIRESEEKFRNIFEQSKDAIFITDKDINVLDVNNSLCTLTGYSKDELLNSDLRPMQDARSTFRSLIDKTGSLRDYEYTLHRKDGTLTSVLINAAVRTDKAGNILGYQGIIHDITEHKRLDEERQKTARLESIGTLAGGIAHDFNNILGAIIGNISLAKMEIPPGHDAHDLMKDTEKAVMRAKELTRQLLTFARGGAPVKKRTQLRSTIMDTANFTTRGTNVRCRFNIADDLKPADVDEGQISQVVQNLVLNARQAMPTGGDIDITSENIALTEEMRLGRRLPLSPGIYIRITVKDNGVGIKPEHLDKIFDPYFTTKQSGSGLGLATCYSIVRNHGGHISVESSPDRGSTFYVYLPAAEGRTGHAGKEETKEAIPMSGKILVMDDEAALRTTIRNMLKRIGFEHIEVAASGEEALELYEKALQAKQPFDVVILDLTVPGGMGGKETMEKLREVDPGVVAIVSSGYANEAIMADYINYGFKGVIVKPYTFDELKSTLHELIDSLNNN